MQTLLDPAGLCPQTFPFWINWQVWVAQQIPLPSHCSLGSTTPFPQREDPVRDWVPVLVSVSEEVPVPVAVPV